MEICARTSACSSTGSDQDWIPPHRCASIYDNEKKVGDAIQNNEVTQSELWITSKLWSNCHGKDQIEAALTQSLQNLGLEYLNLYLIHWPVSINPEKTFAESADDLLLPEQSPLSETWQATESVCSKGLTKHIGVSNFSVQKLHKLVSGCKQKPEVNQVKHHPLLQFERLQKRMAVRQPRWFWHGMCNGGSQRFLNPSHRHDCLKICELLISNSAKPICKRSKHSIKTFAL